VTPGSSAARDAGNEIALLIMPASGSGQAIGVVFLAALVIIIGYFMVNRYK
jgi:hypothetical protein